MQVSSASSTQSTQSLPSTSSSASAMHTAVLQQGARAQSASILPAAAPQGGDRTAAAALVIPALTMHAPIAVPTMVGPPTVGVPTLGSNLSATPWATVVQPTSRTECNPEVIREEAAALLRHSEELEHTRQRVNEMAGTILLQQKETHEALEKRDELCSQLAEKDHQLHEVEKRLFEVIEEHAQTKRELARCVHDANCAIASSERCEEEQRNSASDRSAAYAELVEQNRVLLDQRSTLESQALEAARRCEDLSTRACAATEAARRVEGEKRDLEQELKTMKVLRREAEHETHDLRCRTAMLEDRLQNVQEQRRRAEEDQQRAEQDLRQWYHKFIESNKENASLQKASQDCKKELCDIEKQLWQERSVKHVASPGEYLKLMKAHEGESLAADNSKLKKSLTKAQCDLDLCVRKLGEQDKLIKDLQEATNNCRD